MFKSVFTFENFMCFRSVLFSASFSCWRLLKWGHARISLISLTLVYPSGLMLSLVKELEVKRMMKENDLKQSGRVWKLTEKGRRWNTANNNSISSDNNRVRMLRGHVKIDNAMIDHVMIVHMMIDHAMTSHAMTDHAMVEDTMTGHEKEDHLIERKIICV